MKIKTKLMILFCILVFVPTLLIGASVAGFCNFQVNAMKQTYGMEDANAYSLINSVQLMNHYTERVFEQIRRTARQKPKRMEDREYLESVNEELHQKYSYLVVYRSGVLYYNGAADNDSVLKELHEYGTSESSLGVGNYLVDEGNIFVKQVDFRSVSGAEMSAYVITATDGSVLEVRRLLVAGIVLIVVVFVLTAFMMTLWIYRSILNPLRKLQDAAESIKEGNLDFYLDVSRDDEIGELCSTFEEMRKRLKDNAEEKLSNEKENRALISNIAHDLKTPITAVKGYAEGIMDGVANTPEKVDKYVRTIYNKANEMDTLINELTLYSKIDTNRIPYEFARIHVSEYFKDCVEEIGLDLEAKGIGLSYFNYTTEDTMIIADPEQLRRVINNIIGNSVKYMNKTEKFINIRIKDVGDFIQVEIEDNGRGIAQKDLPYIFDRFYRTDASRNSATGGSGIGLSIVKKIVEDHGGKIWATSKEDAGTIMYFVIRKYQEVTANE